MRVYLYEMVSGGGAFLPAAVTNGDTCLAELGDFHQVPNLIADGSQMLEQLVRLFLNLPDFEVWISVDSRLKSFGEHLRLNLFFVVFLTLGILMLEMHP